MDGPRLTLRISTNSPGRVLRYLTAMLLTVKAVQTYRDKGTYPAEMFERLPSAQELPDYYVIVQRPIAISTISENIRQGAYKSLAEFQADFDLLVSNTALYYVDNKRTSKSMVKESETLKEVFTSTLRLLIGELGLVMSEEFTVPKPKTDAEMAQRELLDKILVHRSAEWVR